MFKVARQFDIATSLIYEWRREALGGLAPVFTPTLMMEGADVAHHGAPEVEATSTPIRVELAGGAQMSI